MRLNAYLLAIGLALSAESADGSFTLEGGSETVPAGSVVQVKFAAASPQAVLSGGLSIDFDPEFFGDVMAVSAFSAAGDAQGYASVRGRHVEIYFSSPSATMGVVRGLPVVAVTVPVLPGLPVGARSAVYGSPALRGWYDAQFKQQPVAVTAGMGRRLGERFRSGRSTQPRACCPPVRSCASWARASPLQPPPISKALA